MIDYTSQVIKSSSPDNPSDGNKKTVLLLDMMTNIINQTSPKSCKQTTND